MTQQFKQTPDVEFLLAIRHLGVSLICHRREEFSVMRYSFRKSGEVSQHSKTWPLHKAHIALAFCSAAVIRRFGPARLVSTPWFSRFSPGEAFSITEPHHAS
jgi:hypothetical protein